MAKMDDPLPEGTTVLQPDKSLLRKLGGAKLDVLLSPEVIKKAEIVMHKASADFYRECVAESGKLQSAVVQLAAGEKNTKSIMEKINSIASRIKSGALLSGYNLVAALAESLNLRCEGMMAEQATPSELKIIAWHAESIAHLLDKKLVGDGGETGKAILAEIERVKLSSH